ncbi:hypothetical protein CBR_g22387 [Chara braunii]|uniref:Uncharacterized protein n=1 Tax=Chara braunii TaxID=69332 RepID=A0A388JUY7_CHABU|nr:hypothetical protein CBR_g22387 [Chara braunii]|eukprot:GBG61590.1 hypothetical protein CBR_g22387 [Chara braunii]
MGMEGHPGDADYQRRLPPLCYGCKVPRHYRSDCWRFWSNVDSRRKAGRDGFTCPPDFDRGRSGFPAQSHGVPFRRSPLLDSKTMSKIAELGDVVIPLKEFLDLEKSRKLEKERKCEEREEARREREEARKREERIREAKARRAKKLEKTKRREEE